jgi:hypothetical protein
MLDLVLRDDPDRPAMIHNGGVIIRLLTAALERTNASHIVDVANVHLGAVTGNAASRCLFERLCSGPELLPHTAGPMPPSEHMHTAES